MARKDRPWIKRIKRFKYLMRLISHYNGAQIEAFVKRRKF